MTLNDLIFRAAQLSRLLTSGGIPLRIAGEDVELCFSLEEDKNGLYVEMKRCEEVKEDVETE